MAVKCSGVSIVWCSIMGWLLCLLRSIDASPSRVHLKRNVPVATRSSLLQNHLLGHRLKRTLRGGYLIGCDALALLYYAATADTVTTVPHLCAIALGMTLWKATLCRRGNGARRWGRGDKSLTPPGSRRHHGGH